MEIISVEAFLKYHAKIKSRTRKVISIIPPQFVDWQYKQHAFSPGDIVRHIAAIETNLYAEIVQGKPSIYKGCSKEIAEGYASILHFFDAMHQRSSAVFSQLGDEGLKAKCTMPGGATLSVASALRAMVEHEVHHRGQLYLMLSLIGVETPPLFGLTSENVIQFGQQDTSK